MWKEYHYINPLIYAFEEMDMSWRMIYDIFRYVLLSFVHLLWIISKLKLSHYSTASFFSVRCCHMYINFRNSREFHIAVIKLHGSPLSTLCARPPRSIDYFRCRKRKWRYWRRLHNHPLLNPSWDIGIWPLSLYFSSRLTELHFRLMKISCFSFH